MEATVFLTVGISLIGVIVTIASTLGGFAYRILDNKISENKVDAKQAVDDEERRRKEAIFTVTGTVNEHYETLRRDIADIKVDVKEIRRHDD
jgi:hypothetical protein